MKTSNQILIKGDPDLIYRYASEIERWPEILPHYRSVRILDCDGSRRTVTMHCVRSFGFLNYPCRWRADQELRPEERRIIFRHLGGPAKGMTVEWRIEPSAEGVLTVIDHEFNVPIPLIGSLYTDRIVGPLFVHAVAGKTLAAIKSRVESFG